MRVAHIMHRSCQVSGQKIFWGWLPKQIFLSWQNPLTKTKQNYFLQKQSVKPTPWYQQLLWVLIVSSFRSWTSQEWEGIVNLCWEHINGTLRVPRVLNVELTSMKKCMFENWEWWRLLVQLPAAESWSALLLAAAAAGKNPARRSQPYYTHQQSPSQAQPYYTVHPPAEPYYT